MPTGLYTLFTTMGPNFQKEGTPHRSIALLLSGAPLSEGKRHLALLYRSFVTFRTQSAERRHTTLLFCSFAILHSIHKKQGRPQLLYRSFAILHPILQKEGTPH
jgi:hypothetical protein